MVLAVEASTRSPEWKPKGRTAVDERGIAAANLSKLCSRACLKAAAADLPRPMVFTNGVFDLLHRGHVENLAAARNEGRSLVVGVNSDASARALGKGPGRPLNTAFDRASVVAALESVSLVVVFNEVTPLALIAELRPEVYVKGGDYRLEELPEVSLVRQWGGRALTLPYRAGYSSTALLRRILVTDSISEA
jgi:D-glycero-beta-D-manno-heptose 1-phosphate adenylyltransferase